MIRGSYCLLPGLLVASLFTSSAAAEVEFVLTAVSGNSSCYGGGCHTGSVYYSEPFDEACTGDTKHNCTPHAGYDAIADRGLLASRAWTTNYCDHGCAIFQTSTTLQGPGSPYNPIDDLIFTGPAGETSVFTSLNLVLDVLVNAPGSPTPDTFGDIQTTLGYLGPFHTAGHYQLTTSGANYALGTPAALWINLRAIAFCQAAYANPNNPIGEWSARVHFPIGQPVFNLPPGYSVNCASLNIVDNYWLGTQNPQVLESPTDLRVSVGYAAQFSVRAVGAQATYQWRRAGVALIDGPTATGSIVSGATTPNLVISNCQLDDSGSYDCVVTNIHASDTSASASLTVVIPGDMDGDCDVDITDLAVLLAAYGSGNGGDINGDGVTDLTDLGLLLANYGNTCP